MSGKMPKVCPPTSAFRHNDGNAEGAHAAAAQVPTGQLPNRFKRFSGLALRRANPCKNDGGEEEKDAVNKLDESSTDVGETPAATPPPSLPAPKTSQRKRRYRWGRSSDTGGDTGSSGHQKRTKLTRGKPHGHAALPT